MVPEWSADSNIRQFAIYPSSLRPGEDGHNYPVDTLIPAERIFFENIYICAPHTITVTDTSHGDVSASHTSASKDTTITLTAKPDQGYVLDTLTVLDSKDQAIQLTGKDGKFTFAMPDSAVTVKASFKAQAPSADHPFTDVPGDSWYEDAVIWAVDKGITGGTSATTFSPDAICTRAQAVTFLWRAAGSPAVSGSAAFSDVASGAYYAKAVKWAQANDVTSGVGGGRFGSNDNCTRAQIVTFIWRSVEK